MIVGSKHQIFQIGKYANRHDKVMYLLMIYAVWKKPYF